MIKSTSIAVIISLALILVSVASVSFAAGGGSGHETHPVEMTAENHHQMASEDMTMDCPAHHDGHTMKDAQCAVACFTMMSALGWQGISFTSLGVMSGNEITLADQFYKTRTPHIPTPPPNFV